MIQHVNEDHPDIDQLWDMATGLVDIMVDRLTANGAPGVERRLISDNINRAMFGAGSFSLVTAGPCVVGYTIDTPWWSTSKLFIEQFVIRYKAGNFADTLRELELHARELGCDTFVIADLAMTRQASYGEYLKRKGFREVSREYIKGVT